MEKRRQADLTDAQWELVRPHLDAATGRPPSVDRREIVSADLDQDQARTGCPWRMLPKNFPYWGTVQSCFRRWRRNGVRDRRYEAQRSAERARQGRDPAPTVIDSRGVKTAEKGASRLRRG